MSKDTPEVGDVWINKTGTKSYYIVKLTNFYVQCIINGGGVVNKYYDLFRNYEYIGKSKVNINDLFEVQDD